MMYNIFMIVFLNTVFTFIIYTLTGKEGVLFNKLWKRVLALIPPFTIGFFVVYSVYEILKSLSRFIINYFRE